MNLKAKILANACCLVTVFFADRLTGHILAQATEREAKAKFEDGLNAYLTVELEMGKYLSYCTFETDESGEFNRLGEGRFVHARKLVGKDKKLILSPIDRYRFVRREWESFKPNNSEARFFLLRKLPEHRYYILGNGPPEPCNVIDSPFPNDLQPPKPVDVTRSEFSEWKQKVNDATENYIAYAYLDRALYLPIVTFSDRHSSANEFEEIPEDHFSGKYYTWVKHGYDAEKNRYWGIAHFVIDGDEPESELVIELDPNQGMRPVEYMFRRITLDGSGKPNQVYIRAQTEWEQYGEFWLPKQVTVVDRSGGGNDHDIEVDKIEWWVGDDVPDEIFELKDFSKSCHEKSIVDELIAKRMKEREQTEKEKQRQRR